MPNWVYNNMNVTGKEDDVKQFIADMSQPIKTFKSNPEDKWGHLDAQWEEYSDVVFSFWNAIAPTDLEQGLLAHRYDVQFSLYLLALHRLLQARLPGYDYETHMGGAVYLFARGIDQPGAGVFAHRPPHAMIEELDAAFKEHA